MELDDLKQAWNEQNQKLDQILQLNRQNLRTTQLDRTRSALGRFKMYLIFEVLVGSVLFILSGSYIADHVFTPTLSIPAFVLAVSALVAVIGGIRKLVLLGQIDYADPITAIQKKAESVKLSFLGTIRLMIMMLPFYMVYVVLGLNLLFGWDILADGDRGFLWANLVFSLILVVPAVWMFRQLSLRNIGNPVVRAVVQGSGGVQMIAAMEFLNSIREFEGEDAGQQIA